MAWGRAERWRRGDVVAVAVLTVAAVVAAVLLVTRSPEAGTTSDVAAEPLLGLPEPAQVPRGFVLAWQERSGATRAPLAAGPAVVTAEGGTVTGRDPESGTAVWSYTRDVPLCAAAAGFPGSDGGGRVFALYRNDTDPQSGPDAWCSELTTLRPDTGARAAQRTTDTRPGVWLLPVEDRVALVGADHAEVLRSPDLVRTLEYGEVPAPEQPGQQPRTGCRYGSSRFDAGRLAVVERCPDEGTDRVTVLSSDGPDGAEVPEVLLTRLLPVPGAVVVAVAQDRTALALPDPPRLLVLDTAGAEVGTEPLAVPQADLAADLGGGTVPVAADAERRYWWTGSRTVALDAVDLTPRWTLPGTLGPGVPYAGALLVPVPQGLAVVEPSSGRVVRTIALDRPDPGAPVTLAVSGPVLLEQRGPELVALRPTD